MICKYLIYLLTLIISCIPFNGYSQDFPKSDSLINVFKTIKEDTNKFKLLDLLFNQYINTHPDTALNYAHRQQGIAKIIIDLPDQQTGSKRLATALNNIVHVHWLQGNYPEALKFCFEKLKIHEQIKDKPGIAQTLSNIGLIYQNLGDYPKTLKHYLQALEINKELRDTVSIATVLGNIGSLYNDQEDHTLALKYYFEALEIDKVVGNKNGIARHLVNIGNIYREFADEAKSRQDTVGSDSLYVNALKHYFDALELAKELDLKNGIAIILGNIGIVYSNQANAAKSRKDITESDFLNQKALKHYILALEIARVLGEKVGIARHLANIGAMYTKQAKSISDIDLQKEKYKEAEKYLKESLAINREIGKISGVMYAYQLLSTHYTETNHYLLALQYHKQYSAIKDTIFNENSEKQIVEMETKYETDKKEKEISLLKNEKEIQDLEIARQEAEFNRQKVLRNSIIGGLLLLLVIVYLLYKRYVAKQRARLLQKEKDEILAKQQLLDQRNTHQKELLDSILKTQEEERKRIAAELHDGLGNTLSTAKLNLDGLQNEYQALDQAKQTMYKNSVSLLDNACKDVRTISHNMMPGALVKLGLIPALRDFLDKLKQSGKFEIDFSNYGLEARMDETIEIVLYRIIQEIFNNIIKHSEAKQVSVQIFKHENTLNLMVEDDGKGFDLEKVKGQNGLGVNNIESRVEFLKGKIEYDSKPGKGTNIIIVIPVS